MDPTRARAMMIDSRQAVGAPTGKISSDGTVPGTRSRAAHASKMSALASASLSAVGRVGSADALKSHRVPRGAPPFLVVSPRARARGSC